MVSGVPQGSVLGPVLFIVYINDVVDIFAKCIPSLFADDLKLYIRISNIVDFVTLQNGLTALHEWSALWQLSIADKKCSVFTIGNFSFNSNFNIDSATLPFSSEIVDLGVTIDQKLNFSKHISNIVKTATARANLIIRSFISKDVHSLCRAFITYVRPIVEYNSPVWSPSSVTSINLIESVQRRFTKRLDGLTQFSYFDRLVVLQWTTLETRRIYADLIMCFKIVHGLVAIEFSNLFTFSTSSTRGHKFKLLVPCCKCNVRKNFFSVRIIRIWNDLPESIVDSASISIFKNAIKNYDFSKYCSVDLF